MRFGSQSIISLTLLLSGPAGAQFGSLSFQANSSRLPPATDTRFQKGILAIASARAGGLFVDGRQIASLSAGQVATFSLIAGQHFVELRDRDGSKVWEKIVTISSGTQTAEKIDRVGGADQGFADSSGQRSASPPRVFSLTPMDRCLEFTLLGRFSDRAAECPNSKVYKDAVEKSSLSTLPDDGTRLYRIGKYKEALTKSTESIDLFSAKQGPVRLFRSQLAQAYNIRACTRFVLRDFQGSLADFEEATKLYRDIRMVDHGKSYGEDDLDQDRATVFYRLGLFREASVAFQEFLQAYASIMGTDWIPPEQEQLGKMIDAALGRSDGNQPLQSPTTYSPKNPGDAIAEAEKSGNFSPLPGSDACARLSGIAPNTVNYEVHNATDYELRLIISGVVQQDIQVESGGRKSISLPSGYYKILGSVATTGVLPFYGQRTFLSQTSCAVDFIVRPK